MEPEDKYIVVKENSGGRRVGYVCFEGKRLISTDNPNEEATRFSNSIAAKAMVYELNKRGYSIDSRWKAVKVEEE